ncbi:hypothetical protein TKK_0016238 [Trichogramma kaykai]
MRQRSGIRTRGTRGHMTRVAARLQRQAEDPPAPPAPPAPVPPPRLSEYNRSVLAAVAEDARLATLAASNSQATAGAVATTTASATDASAGLPPPSTAEDQAPPAEATIGVVDEATHEVVAEDTDERLPVSSQEQGDEDVLVLCASDSNDEDEAYNGATANEFPFPPVAEVPSHWSDEDWDEGVDAGASPWPKPRWPLPRFPATHNLGLSKGQRRQARREKLAAAIERERKLGEALNRGQMPAPISPPTCNPEQLQRLLAANDRADVVRAKRAAAQASASTSATGRRSPTHTTAGGAPHGQGRAEKRAANKSAKTRSSGEATRPEPQKRLTSASALKKSATREPWPPLVASLPNRRSSGRCDATWPGGATPSKAAQPTHAAMPSTRQVAPTRREDTGGEPWWEAEYQASLRETEPKRRGAVFDGRHMPRDSRVEPPKGGCFICWSTTHGWRTCGQTSEHDFCWNCGRRGVGTPADCPRCREGYQRWMRNQPRRDGPPVHAPRAREVSGLRSPSELAVSRATTPPNSAATITEIVEVSASSSAESLRPPGPIRPPSPPRQALRAIEPPPCTEEGALVAPAVAVPPNAAILPAAQVPALPGPGAMEWVAALNQLAANLGDVSREVREQVMRAAVRPPRRPNNGKSEGPPSKRRAAATPSDGEPEQVGNQVCFLSQEKSKKKKLGDPAAPVSHAPSFSNSMAAP